VQCQNLCGESMRQAKWMAYHSVHADNSDRQSHRFLDSRVDQHQLVESSFSPLAIMRRQNTVAFFAQLFDEVWPVWRVEKIQESVCDRLFEVSKNHTIQDLSILTILVVCMATMLSARIRRQIISGSRSAGFPLSMLSSMTHCKASFCMVSCQRSGRIIQ